MLKRFVLAPRVPWVLIMKYCHENSIQNVFKKKEKVMFIFLKLFRQLYF